MVPRALLGGAEVREGERDEDDVSPPTGRRRRHPQDCPRIGRPAQPDGARPAPRVVLTSSFTRADAGTLFLCEGDQLRFAVVQNDSLVHRIGEREMITRRRGSAGTGLELFRYLASPSG